MLKVLIKFFLSSGAVLGTFTVTGNLPWQKKDNGILVSDVPDTNEQGEIKTVKDITIFERKNNCSFTFVHRWGEQKVYSIDEFLEKNVTNKDKYINKAIKKANEAKESCKKNGLLVFFYQGDDFNLESTVSSIETVNK